jgi:hypothetical protein
MKTHFADPADLLNFTLTITPDEGTFPFLRTILLVSVKLISFIKGMYKGGAFTFSFAINTNYPHDPPKVKCIPKVKVITREMRSATSVGGEGIGTGRSLSDLLLLHAHFRALVPQVPVVTLRLFRLPTDLQFLKDHNQVSTYHNLTLHSVGRNRARARARGTGHQWRYSKSHITRSSVYETKKRCQMLQVQLNLFYRRKVVLRHAKLSLSSI